MPASDVIVDVRHILRSRPLDKIPLLVITVKVVARCREHRPNNSTLHECTLENVLLFVCSSYGHVPEGHVPHRDLLTPVHSDGHTDPLAMDATKGYAFNLRDCLWVVTFIRVLIVVRLDHDPNPDIVKRHVPIGYVSDITTSSRGRFDTDCPP